MVDLEKASQVPWDLLVRFFTSVKNLGTNGTVEQDFVDEVYSHLKHITESGVRRQYAQNSVPAELKRAKKQEKNERKEGAMDAPVKTFEKKLPMATRVLGKRELENFWVSALSLFGSDYSQTYRSLLEREAAGEEIGGEFSYSSLHHRMQVVRDHMPAPGPAEQNTPQYVACPKFYRSNPLNEGSWRMVMFYQSNSGNSLLSYWEEGLLGNVKVRLELFQYSSLLQKLGGIEEIFK